MTTSIVDRLNFSHRAESSDALEVSKSKDHVHDKLEEYCLENDIKLSPEDTDIILGIMQDHGCADISTDTYFFWFD